MVSWLVLLRKNGRFWESAWVFDNQLIDVVSGFAGETDCDEGCDLLLGLNVLKEFGKE